MKRKILSIIITLLFAGNIYCQTNIVYQYDKLNRVTRVTYPNGTIIDYSYDQLNNRTSKIIAAASQLPIAAGTITGNTTVCQGQSSVIYTVPMIANAISYIWTLPTGAVGQSMTNTISVDYNANAVSGNIIVKGHNSYGDGAISNIAVIVNPLPSANAGNDVSICYGSSTQLSATGGGIYSWSPLASLNNASVYNPIATPTINTSYIVTVTNSYGCSKTDNVTISVSPLPQTPVISENITGNLISSSTSGNQWYEDSILIPGAIDQSYFPINYGSYYVIVTDNNGCKSHKSNIINIILTNVNDFSNDEFNATIAPNPFMDQVTFSIKSSKDMEINLNIWNTAGQLVKKVVSKKSINHGNEEKITVDLSDLKDGLYIGVIDNGIKINELKMVKSDRESKGNNNSELLAKYDEDFNTFCKKINKKFLKKH